MAAGSARAQAPEATPELREKARSAYREGQKAFNTGKYQDAAAAFQAAFDAIANPVVLLSLAESRLKAGQLGEALSTFKKYLTLRPDAPDRATIEQRILLLGQKPGFVSITSEPADADVELEGSPMFRTPLQLELAPGTHEIRCTRPGYRPRTYAVTAEPGARLTLHCELDVLPPMPHIAPLDDVQVRAIPKGRPMTLIWITGGIGAAALVNSAVFGALAISANREFQDKPSTKTADRGETFGLVADIGFGVGAAALATAAALYLLNDDADACSAFGPTGAVIRF